MSLDDRMTVRQWMQRQQDEDRALAFAEYAEQRMLEAEETEARRWEHRMLQAASERPSVHYLDGPDRRLHGWREAIADGVEPDSQRGGAA